MLDPCNYGPPDVDMGERICTCGALTNKDEMMHCAICDKDTCPFCSINISAMLCEEVPERIRQYILRDMNKKNRQELCPTCLEKYKVKYVMQIPVLELPLYINENWGSETATRIYKARLAGESIVEPKEDTHGSREA